MLTTRLRMPGLQCSFIFLTVFGLREMLQGGLADSPTCGALPWVLHWRLSNVSQRQPLLLFITVLKYTISMHTYILQLGQVMNEF